MSRMTGPSPREPQERDLLPFREERIVPVEEVRAIVDRIVGINDIIPGPRPLRAPAARPVSGRKLIRSGQELHLVRD